MAPVNKRHLKYIMSSFTTKRLNSIDPPLRLVYCATPKVVAERFLLQVKREFRSDTAAVSFDAYREERICPHLLISSPYYLTRELPHDMILRIFGPVGLLVHVRLTLAGNFGRTLTGHCPHCPTDYIVLAHPGIVTICSWHDLGSYGNPFSEQWTVHTRNSQNEYSSGLIVHHHPGSVRDMYLRDLPMGGRRRSSRFS